MPERSNGSEHEKSQVLKAKRVSMSDMIVLAERI
jgi:hypothetical protein